MVRRTPIWLVVTLGLILVVLTPSTAQGRPQARLVVREGRVSATYPNIAGVYPTHGPADRRLCGGAGPCDVIPVSIEQPSPSPGDADVLVTFTVTWNAENGNVLNAALFDDGQASSDGDAGRRETPGLVKWSSGGGSGSLALRTANPRGEQYSLAVSNSTGENRGYTVIAELAVHGRSSGSPLLSGPAQPAGGPAGGGAKAAGAPSGSEPLDAATGSAARGPDARFDGATGVPAGSSRLLDDATVAGALVLLAAGLLGLAGVGAWRARRGPERGIGSWFRDMRLFWKLMMPFVVVILVVGVAGTFLTARFLTERADTELSQRLVQGSGAAEGYLRDQEFALLDAARFAANVQGLPEALATGDGARAEQALASVAAVNEDLDVIAAVAPDGRSLATISRERGVVAPHAGEDWSAAPPVEAALSGRVDRSGDKYAGLLEMSDGSSVLVVAGPVRTDRAVGAVVVGRRAGPIAVEAARRSDAAVALYDGRGQRVAASDGTLPLRLGQPVADGRSRRERSEVAGRDTARLSSPLDVRDRRVGTLSVAVPAGSAFSAARGTALRLTALVALAIAAIVAIGTVLSRYILRIVNPLLATNRAFGRGELDARAPVQGGDELGELAQGFNQMAEQLQASYADLERRVAERTEELQRLHQEVTSAAAAKDEFFASVSHEFRSPLFAILANSEVLVDPELAPDDDAERREFLGTIHASARQLVGRVNEILELARTSATDVHLDLAEVDLGEVLEEVTASVEALGRRDDLAVTLQLPKRLPRVIGDRDRLVQILLNLGSNAVKYSGPGGRVTIAARAADGEVVIEVVDIGVGIPAEVGKKVFEPYYVVNGSSATAGRPSTGLGLAVTKRLVEAHGGTIDYSSIHGEGTTFTVRLPVGS